MAGAVISASGAFPFGAYEHDPEITKISLSLIHI